MTRAKDMSDFGVSASAGAIVNVQQAVKLGTQSVTGTSYVLLTGLTIDTVSYTHLRAHET